MTHENSDHLWQGQPSILSVKPALSRSTVSNDLLELYNSTQCIMLFTCMISVCNFMSDQECDCEVEIIWISLLLNASSPQQLAVLLICFLYSVCSYQEQEVFFFVYSKYGRMRRHGFAQMVNNVNLLINISSTAARMNTSCKNLDGFSAVINSVPYLWHKALMCLYFHLLVDSK